MADAGQMLLNCEYKDVGVRPVRVTAHLQLNLHHRLCLSRATGFCCGRHRSAVKKKLSFGMNEQSHAM